MDIIVSASARRDGHLAWLTAQYTAIGYHNPKEMPPDPFADAVSSGPANPEVEAEIRAIRRRVKVAHDTAKARGRHGS